MPIAATELIRDLVGAMTGVRAVLTMTSSGFLRHQTCGAVLVLATALFLAGCGERAAIRGEVRDNFGKPIAGAEVVLADGATSAVTDAAGAFVLEHAPGRFPVRITAPGYAVGAYDLTLRDRDERPPVEPVLQRLPPSEGLWLVAAEDYLPVNPCLFRSIPVPDPVGRRYIVQRGIPTRLPDQPPGAAATFLDYRLEAPDRPAQITLAPDDGEFLRTLPVPGAPEAVITVQKVATEIAPEFASTGRWFSVVMTPGVYVHTDRIPGPVTSLVPDEDGTCAIFSVGPAGDAWLDQRITQAQFDAFLDQLATCWRVPADEAARRQVLTLRIALSADGRLAGPPMRMRGPLDTPNQPGFTQAMADGVAAVEACAPYLMFPADTYEAWQNLTVTIAGDDFLRE